MLRAFFIEPDRKEDSTWSPRLLMAVTVRTRTKKVLRKAPILTTRKKATKSS